MATYVKINDVLHPAIITGRLSDDNWNNRASKAIKLEMTYTEANELFHDDMQWSIVQDVEAIHHSTDEEGNPIHIKVTEQEVYNNSEYSIAGDIIDHRNGKVTVKMGKPTAEEQLVEMASIAANAEYQLMLSMEDVEE